MTDPGAREASVADETAWFYDRLFSGMDLDGALQRRLYGVIADYVVRTRAIRAPAPEIWDVWEHATALHDQRDRELQALLARDDRVAFATNAAAVREFFATVRLRAHD